MFFSVIIPTCNRPAQLADCLNAFSKIAKSGYADYEIIVTDDSRNLVTGELIKNNYPGVKWIDGAKKGPAANRNNGAKHAKGAWLIFIDDDCMPGTNLLFEYKKAIDSNPQTFAFEGAIYPDDWGLLKKDMAECPVNTNGGCFWSANICINTNLFKLIGGFNEKYIIAAQEDQQMKLDIEKQTQKKILFLKEASVIHPVRFPSIRKKIFIIPVASKNFCFYAYKNKQALGYNSLFSFLKNQFLVHIKQCYFYIKTRKFKNLSIAVTWLCIGVPLNMYNYISLLRRNKT